MYIKEYKNGYPYVSILYPYNLADALYVENIDISKIIKYINEKNIKQVCLHNFINFDFILRCPSIEHIYLEYAYSDLKDIWTLQKENDKYIFNCKFETLYAKNNLISLSIFIDINEKLVKNKSILEGRQLIKLKSLSINGISINNIEKMTGLRKLHLVYFKEKDCEKLKNLSNLESISLINCKITSLKGLENLLNLKAILINNCRMLEDISYLCNVYKNLKYIEIDGCNKIINLENTLNNLFELRVIRIFGNLNVPNINFINNMHFLKMILIHINIIDGNLYPLTRIPYASISANKKHYNLKDNQLNKNLEIEKLFVEDWMRTDPYQ